MPGKFNPFEEDLIASFRGLSQEDSPARDAGSKSLGSLLEACIERYHIGRSTPEETVQENWERIVGPDFAKRCHPERIDHSGTLLVQAPNATVRRELIFLEERILTALGSLPGCHHINRVVFKAGQ